MEISRSLGIASFTNYLVIHMIYCCVVVFCLYSKKALYNNRSKLEHNLHYLTYLGTANISIKLLSVEFRKVLCRTKRNYYFYVGRVLYIWIFQLKSLK